VALPAFARRTQLLLRTGQQSIDITCAPRQQQQTRSGFATVGPFWDRQTDGRTDSANNGSSIHQRKKTRVTKPFDSSKLSIYRREFCRSAPYWSAALRSVFQLASRQQQQRQRQRRHASYTASVRLSQIASAHQPVAYRTKPARTTSINGSSHLCHIHLLVNSWMCGGGRGQPTALEGNQR